MPDKDLNPNYETLLETINELKSRIGVLEEENKKIKSDNDEIKAFNRELLKGPVKKVEVPNNEKALEELEKFLKGD